MKKIIICICLAFMVTVVSPALTNVGTPVAEASVAGKSHTYYISKANTKVLYNNMKKVQSAGGWASLAVGLIPGGQAAAIGMALSSNSVGKKEVEKAYHKNMRLKVTYTYGRTMSTNTTTFKAVN